MNIINIESRVKELVKNLDIAGFIYDFMLAYNLPKATITRLRKGDHNLSKDDNEIGLKGKLYFREEFEEDLHVTIDNMRSESKYKERFIIATDYKQFLAIDIKTNDRLDVSFEDLGKHYDFFLPWAGREKHKHYVENKADVDAAVRMAKLFDEIKKDNPNNTPEFIHGLNIFLSRLLFCFFAEDTDIFDKDLFTNALCLHTKDDGSDLDIYLDTLFEVLDTDDKSRDTDLSDFLNKFPYVNGSLFRDKHEIPKFTFRSRKAIIEAGELNWKDINPDIFGSMIQAVITPEDRGGLGMHYTSVPNIMKVIEPLFLDDLKDELEKAGKNLKKLYKLLARIQNIKIFDPACGSGNFLIIAYKEMRRLEMEIFKRGEILALSGIELSQFYGIELDDFAHEVARLALWLAEHQMNVEFFRKFGRTNPTLPLKEAGHIWHGNACRLNWEEVCPKEDGDEIYIMGNPPYLGYVMQDKLQKEDMSIVFELHVKYKKLDYISCWFFKGANYILNSKASLSFVTTNSITQGEQVELLWPTVFNMNLEISFAHQSFKWNNNAKFNAGVSVVIIGLRNISKAKKLIFNKNRKSITENINPYLTRGENVIVSKRSKPLSDFSIMMKGSQPTDGGFLLLDQEEMNNILLINPEANIFIKRFYGAKEYIRGEERFCLWIPNEGLTLAFSIISIRERLNGVSRMRLSSSKRATNKLAKYPNLFGEIRYFEKSGIIVPTISSERREYIPCGFVDENTIVSNTAQVIYDYKPYLLSVISSRMQLEWIKAIGGKFKTDYIFSSSLCYNTFPFPEISEKRKQELTETTMRILEEREKHSDKTLAQLYDPDKMPEGLREAHRLNDEAVERCYRRKPFISDEERLEYLFKLYEKMIGEESAKELELKAQKKKIKTK